MRVVFPLCLLFSLVWGLYEDQIGKFDWRQQFVGCPSQVTLDKSKNTDRYVVSTSENVLASLSANSGDIVWRRVQETADPHPLAFAVHNNVLCTVADGGRVIRIWSKLDGSLKSQLYLGLTQSTHAPAVTISGKLCVVASSNKLTAVSIEDGSKQWEMDTERSDWTALIPHRDGVAVVGGSKEKDQLHVKWVDGRGMQTLNRILDAILFHKDRVVLSGRHVVGFEGSTLYSLDILADAPEMKVEVEALEGNVKQIVPFDLQHFGVRTVSSTLVYDASKGFKKVLSLPLFSDTISFVENKGENKGQFVMVASQTNTLSVHDLKSGKEVMKTILDSSTQRAPFKSLSITSNGNEWVIFAVGVDCRVEHIILDVPRKAHNIDWTREEGLSRISAVEMLDLPLSESQAAIETEFSDKEGNIISSFVRRILSQLEQLKRWISHSVNAVFNVGTLLQMRSASSFSDLLNTVRNAAKSSSSLRGQPLERDDFNLRKLVVATSLDGSVYGIDNSDGSVRWRIHLGVNTQGLSTVSGEVKIPILVQRTTAFYNLDAQIVVAYKDSKTGRGHLVFINPMTGNVVDRKEVVSIKRVDLVPFTGDNHLHSVVAIGNDKMVTVIPTLPVDAFNHALPLHVMDVDKAGTMTGYRVDLLHNRLVPLWSGSLNLGPEATVVAVKGKPASQRTHSQGRVLIDRSVMYKYTNPNAVAIATVDAKALVVNIVVIDAVSGQTVHSARLARASGPVHMVHCENWVSYSYWSEKGRRTEIGIVELYEGDEQTNSEKFDSMSPTRKPPVTEQSAFIFSQGIQAMAVSETEQGVSHRSLLVALPFGNIFEVNRRFIDAMRPLEITAEMREEGGFIPYMPEIPIATEDMVNYNQTVTNIRGIKTAPSGLESTSLVLAYGLDLFYTRLTPSGTFDILKDDFDHVLICLVLVALIVGSIVCRRLARNNALKQQWA